ncbi:hypothetical protein HDU84_000515 [Entophlyctis sp. JEL0112]|nr:hypothetical protein HDU84_000515 [Entophlyctis sp. JEL0112]
MVPVARAEEEAALLQRLRLRILCLHGSQQTAEIMRERLNRLERALTHPQTASPLADLIYIDGPILLPLRHGDSVPMRTWFSDPAHSTNRHLEPSVRTSRCACEMLDLMDRVWRRYGPFDGVIGFSAGAIAAAVLAACPQRYPNLSFAIFASCPDVPSLTWADCCSLPNPIEIPHFLRCLHVFGSEDKLVPQSESMKFAVGAMHSTIQHNQGHSFPMRKSELEQYVSFVRNASAALPEFQGIRSDERESLQAIYPDELTVSSGALIELFDGVEVITVKLSADDNAKFKSPVKLHFRLGSSYPLTFPTIDITHDMGMLEFSSSIESALLKAMMQTVSQLAGSAMIFDAISAAVQYLQDYSETEHATIIEDVGLDVLDSESDASLDAIEGMTNGKISLSYNMASSKNSRGKWTHTIGLVGKPSAGKSTFFNAATRTSIAKVAPHPFTTIDPNVSQATWKVPPDRVPKMWAEGLHEVYVPCIVKDVAGLVPGAWEGRGRGNRFLNDLCDADVLIHIVDASGLSDSDGNILPEDTASPTDPLTDIHWVRAELFQWIFNNIAKKWDSIVKRPQRLPLMFSGYQAPKWLVIKVLTSAGFDLSVSPQYAKQFWSLKGLEGAVNEFLDARFPILLAMNKAERITSENNISRMRKLFGDQLVVPVCAASEVWLQAKREEGIIEYQETAYESRPRLKKNQELELTSDIDEWQRAQVVIDRFNNTGVERALAAAVMLRPPTLCFPVEEFEECRPLTGNYTCLPLKPGSTVGDVFEILAHGADGVLNGQFVRAEGTGISGGAARPVRKEAEVGVDVSVVRIMSNRKSRWQRVET